MRGGGERLLCVKMKQWRESLTDCTCGSRVLEEQIFGPLAVEHSVLLSTKTVLIWQFSFFFSQKKVFESRKINHLCLGVSILMEACSTKKKNCTGEGNFAMRRVQKTRIRRRRKEWGRTESMNSAWSPLIVLLSLLDFFFFLFSLCY